MSINYLELGSVISSMSPLTSFAYNVAVSLSGLKPEGTDITDKENDKFLKTFREQILLAQELAITKRIEMANQVEIEEYYEDSKDGHIGLTGSENGITLGLGAKGNRVVKRVYKFKGYNEEREAKYEKLFTKIFEEQMSK